mgnify:CR=1 FL=1
MADGVRARVQVSWRVQGVWFRASTADTARALGLSGWVRNTAQGVEAVFEGSLDAVEAAVAWCREGPPNAVVEHVELTWETAEGLSGFAVRW